MGATQSAPAPAHAPPPAPLSRSEPPPECPMHASSSRARPVEAALNPLNNIPELEQSPSLRQEGVLPLERTASSIPRSSASGRSACPVAGSSKDLATTEAAETKKETWVYPSPQQFYNALVRKGWETPEESVPMMVAIHNWMNEAAWGEVLRWEARYFAPPSAHPGAEFASSAPAPSVDPESLEVSLTRFTGRPAELSPKARFHGWLGTLFPSRYCTDKPFDRHDWMVRRDGWGEAEKEKVHRYVIDYYSAPDDEQGNPVFHLDVRPAIDDFASLRARLAEWTRVKRETWLSPTASQHDPLATAGRVEAVGQKG